MLPFSHDQDKKKMKKCINKLLAKEGVRGVHQGIIIIKNRCFFLITILKTFTDSNSNH